MNRTVWTGTAAALAGVAGLTQAAGTHTGTAVTHAGVSVERTVETERPVYRRTLEIDGVNVFYRESAPGDMRDAGGRERPVVVLLHGFPTSSHMYRDLIPALSREYRVIAPDFPGFGLSDAPPADEFEYTFDRLASITQSLLDRVGAERYVLYVMDYGAPVGYRIASAQPERVAGLVVQNGNAYEEGLREFWDPIRAYWADPSDENRDALRGLLTLEATVWQWEHGTRKPDAISPDNWLVVQPLLDRPGNSEVQLDLFLDYGTNPPLYPAWQAYFREHQPPTLITWGKNDFIFPAEGALPYLRDLPDAELHLLDTGHFALEEDGELIADLMLRFLRERVEPRTGAAEGGA